MTSPTTQIKFTSVRREPAQRFSASKPIKFNRQTEYHGRHNYAVNEIVEYPETGSYMGEKIAHVFRLDPEDLRNPLYDTQYSKGGKKSAGCGQGGIHNARCKLVPDPDGHAEGALCFKQDKSCKCIASFLIIFLIILPKGLGVKQCSFKASTNTPVSTSPPRLSNIEMAKKEVFLKTLGLFGALKRRGCGYKADALPDEASDPQYNPSSPTDSSDEELLELDDEGDTDDNDLDEGGLDDGVRRDPRSPIKPSCGGKIVMEKRSNGAHVVR